MKAQTPDGAALHGAYIKAINNNAIDELMALMAEDVVFQVPGEAELIGRDAVSEWATSFFEAFDAFFTKRQLSFKASGDLAFDRYTYSMRLAGREDGALLVENGKGASIFRRSTDGCWLLIFDCWSPFSAAQPTHHPQTEGARHADAQTQACACGLSYAAI